MQADGRAAVFVQGTADVAYYSGQVGLSSGWSGWALLERGRSVAGRAIKALAVGDADPAPVAGEDIMPELPAGAPVPDLAE